MSPSRNDSITTASYVLIIGSILTILPNIPVINEILPIYTFNAIISKGGANFLETYISSGLFQGNYKPIQGWTMFGFQGQVIWLIFVAIGVCGLLVGLIVKNKSTITIVGLLGGAIDIVISVLVFIGDSQSFDKFGLSDFAFPNYQAIGIGFWIILIGSVILLIAGLIAVKK